MVIILHKHVRRQLNDDNTVQVIAYSHMKLGKVVIITLFHSLSHANHTQFLSMSLTIAVLYAGSHRLLIVELV